MKLLPSWTDGPVKGQILDFVARVTCPASAEFVPQAKRIAVFDNDGTLWCERPLPPQVLFAQDHIKELVMEQPSLRSKQPYKALIEHDLAVIESLGKRAILEFATALFAGMATADFIRGARKWLAAARHPKLGRLLTECVYQPQLELLAYLRMNGFKTFIVTGGGADFVRAFAEDVYGVPPEQVIGSSLKTRFEIRAGQPHLLRLPELQSFNDREVKVENIALHTGRIPLIAVGNSDGDLAMMRYVCAAEGLRLALVIHHDDAEREFAYDRDFRLSPLQEALSSAEAFGLTTVSIRDDWHSVFVPAQWRPERRLPSNDNVRRSA